MKKVRTFALMVLAIFAGGCIPAVMTLLLAREASWAVLLRQCQWGWVYAACIGTLSFFVMERATCHVRRLRRVLQIPALLALFLLLTVVGTLPASAIVVALGWVRPEDFWPAYFAALRISGTITVLLGAIVTGFAVMLHRLDAATLELRNRQLADERARKLFTEARLSSLESRVHPHFLFNTLNSISALIREDPAAAERTVERLAGLLRYSLDSQRSRTVPLEQELWVVRNYLEIEQTRFGERLRYRVEATDDLSEIEVPPFAVQTLVENSVKYAIAPRRRGGEIVVTARAAGGLLKLEVSDDGPGFESPALPPGHGLDNLQDRLTALFEGAARIEIERRGERTVVTVAVPMQTVARP